MVRWLQAARALTLLLACFAITAPAWSAPPPIEDYGKLPEMDHVALSPSGARYAFVATIGEKRRLIVATAENQPIAAQDIGPIKVETVSWAGEDHVLIHASATVELGLRFTASKAELGSVIVIDLKHHKAFQVFGGANEQQVAHTVVGSYGVAAVKDHWYGYFGGYTYDYALASGAVRHDANGTFYPDLYQVDLDTGAFEQVAAGQPGVRGWLVDPTGEVVARLVYDDGTSGWRLTANRAGTRELASGSAPIGGVAIQGFGRSPGSILIRQISEDGGDLEEQPLAGGGATNFDTDETGWPLFDQTSGVWIGSQPVGGEGAPHMFAPEQQAKLSGAFRAFPGYRVSLISYSADLNRLVVFTDGQDDSGSYWIVDIVKGSAKIIGQTYPTVRPESVGPVRWVDYKAADGLVMRGVLTLPPGREPKGLPLVVMPHGGLEGYDLPAFDYWAQAFASRGYAVFQPNFRGSDGYGKAFHRAGFGQWGRKMQTDVSDGVAELARQGLTDSKRVCIVGVSYGGYAALAGVTVQRGLYRCAVSYGAPADLASLLSYERKSAAGADARIRYWRAFLGLTSASEAEINNISPVRLADRADAPILLIHGQDDTVVPVDQSQAMERALRQAGKPVELVTLPGADHWLLQEPSRASMLKASVAFVMKYNPPDVATATLAKAP